ncbi:hypothetical protein JR316_0007295 [Psilocybe cubensis]|uniref:Uncharacterized protein n=2 Tax=Psilocybe cubensis TaxID=181762 RepID=A0ACB8H0G6_PSICU|nr:hypothetical protein JR316_0007295 [Psilocybe cubensis]KAH9480695.1 hypothetical protein JR316_0007295 [Psilocybe cubensis]
MDPHNLSNTISDPTDIPGAQSTELHQNGGVTNPTATALEGLHPQTSADSEAQQSFANDDDVQMDYDDLPPLQEVSDSSDSESESESDRDANEVEMQAVDQNDEDAWIDVDTPPNAPSSSSTPRPSLYSTTSRPTGNRRARVEDDQDEERDRRHPSQRVSSSTRNNSSATFSSSQTGANLPQVQTPATNPTIPHIHRHIIRASFNVAGNLDINNNANALRLFQHLISPPVNTNNNATSNQNNNNNPPNTENPEGGVAPPPPQQPELPQQPGNNGPPIEGMALSFEIGPGFTFPIGVDPQANPPTANPGAHDAHTHQHPPRAGGPLADILGLLGRLGGGLDGETFINFGNMGFGLGMHQEKDDPERAKRLVDGLEVVPVGLVRRLERVGGAGSASGEEPANGGDAGCAICWDKLLDGDGEGFGKEKKEGSAEEGSSSSASETVQPKIVSLPCAHVFHADCLLPWFARPRHTTCPTCRFNIDPENLTHASMRRRERRERAAARQAEEGENAVDGEAPLEHGPENIADELEENIQPIPAFVDILGPGTLATPEEVSEERRQMMEFIRLRNNGVAHPPQTSGPSGRTPTVRAHSAPPESVATNAPAADAATHTASDASTSNIAHPIPSVPIAASTLPRTPTVLRAPRANIGILPIPVVIPIQIPAPANAAAGNPTGNRRMFIVRRPRRTDHVISSAAPHTPQQNTFFAQPRQEGDFGNFLSHMLGDIRQPVPFNSLFSGFTLNLQQPPTPQSAQATPQPATSGNAPTGGSMAGNYFRYHHSPGVIAYRPRTPIPLLRSHFAGPQLAGTPGTTAQSQTPQPNATNSAPGNQAMPQAANGIPPNMPRNVMEIRVDMIFGPGGAFSVPVGNQPGGAVQVGGQVPNQDGHNAHAPPNGNTNDALRREIEARLFDLMANRRPGAGQRVPGQQQEGQPIATPPTPQQPGQQQQAQPIPFGDANPPGANPGMNMHFTGAGRSISEAFSQMLNGLRTQQPRGAPAAQPQPEDGQQQAQPNADAAPQAEPQQQAPPLLHRLGPMGMAQDFTDLFGGGFPEHRAPRPRKDWTLPPAPGPTLRQRIERREREAGLRCHDVSCGIGPSDEDPYGTEIAGAAAGMKQLSIMSKEDKSELCSHTFHGPCLVTAERVALRGADAIIEDGNVEVSCPVCRGTGCVSKADWDEGVVALL